MELIGSRILQILSLTLVGILAGTLVGLGIAMSQLSNIEFAEVLRQILPPLKTWFPVLAFSALIPTALLTLLSKKSRPAFWLSLFATISVISLMIITVQLNVPINDQLEKWDFQNLPSNWEETISNWHLYNLIRTLIIIAGFAALVIASVFYSNSPNKPRAK